MELREVTYLAIALRIVAAVIIGGLIGLERGLKNRPAGLRTYMLVCLGACLIMLTNQYINQATGAGDPMRLGAQVVSGIGFLGAGTIIVTKHNQIKGLTTAAGLWSAAGVGLALGVGFYEAALIAAVAIFSVLTLLQKWDDQMHNHTKMVEIYVELNEGTTVGNFIQQLRDLGLDVAHLQFEEDAAAEDHVRGLIASLKSEKRFNHQVMMGKIRQLPGVRYLEEL